MYSMIEYNIMPWLKVCSKNPTNVCKEVTYRTSTQEASKPGITLAWRQRFLSYYCLLSQHKRRLKC